MKEMAQIPLPLTMKEKTKPVAQGTSTDRKREINECAREAAGVLLVWETGKLCSFLLFCRVEKALSTATCPEFTEASFVIRSVSLLCQTHHSPPSSPPPQSTT